MVGKNNPMFGKIGYRKNKTYEELFGIEKAKEMKERMLGNTFNLGKRHPNGYKKKELNEVV